MSLATESAYPAEAAARDRWIVSRRSPRAAVNPGRVVTAFVEPERSDTGEVVPVATLFLANRECPFRCLMCDLWQHTLEKSVKPGEIVRQIEDALASLPAARQIKLYNSGSFFDARAIPNEDRPAIAALCGGFERVIVECHPAFIGPEAAQFRDDCGVPLEIAIGLETAHPAVLEKLNKRMTLESFARAASFLQSNTIALRTFILLRPPFMDEAEGIAWAVRSTAFAFDCGASVCAIIPTRTGNGALEALAAGGEFASPRLESLEKAHERGVAMQRGRVFADLWDLERFSDCAACLDQRRARLGEMNLTQVVEPRVVCPQCGPGDHACRGE